MKFKQVKKLLQDRGLVPLSCREVGPYKYLENGSKARLRGAGDVARAVAKLVGEGPFGTYPTASWCGNWPRTKRSILAEEDGIDKFWALVEQALEVGLL